MELLVDSSRTKPVTTWASYELKGDMKWISSSNSKWWGVGAVLWGFCYFNLNTSHKCIQDFERCHLQFFRWRL